MERYTALSSGETNAVYNKVKLLILSIPSAQQLSGAKVIVIYRCNCHDIDLGFVMLFGKWL